MEENNENLETKADVENNNNINNNSNNKGVMIGIVIAAVIVLLVIGYFVFGKSILLKNLVGYYELYEMSSGDQNYSHEDLESLKTLGLNVSLELREDKTGTLSLFGDTMELTYDGKNMTVDGESSPYSVKDGKISLEQDGEKLVFEKAAKSNNAENKENSDNNEEQK